MKQLLLICAVVALVGCHAGNAKRDEEAKLAAKAKAIAEARAAAESPTVEIADPIVEKEIRRQRKKPTGELTKADLEKVTVLFLDDNQLTSVKGLEKLTKLTILNLINNKLTDVKGLENLTQLKTLYLRINPDLTKAQIDQLQKALPKCRIGSNPTK